MAQQQEMQNRVIRACPACPMESLGSLFHRDEIDGVTSIADFTGETRLPLLPCRRWQAGPCQKITLCAFAHQLFFWTFPNSLLDNAIRLYYIWHMRPSFEWDAVKNEQNKEKHGVSFFDAQYAFADPHRVIIEDLSHSANEDRFFCFGKVNGGIMTVRFTERQGRIRIIGAGYWRKGRKIYDKENQIHR